MPVYSTKPADTTDTNHHGPVSARETGLFFAIAVYRRQPFRHVSHDTIVYHGLR